MLHCTDNIQSYVAFCNNIFDGRNFKRLVPVCQHKSCINAVGAFVIVEQAFSITIEILESVFVYSHAVSIWRTLSNSCLLSTSTESWGVMTTFICSRIQRAQLFEGFELFEFSFGQFGEDIEKITAISVNAVMFVVIGFQGFIAHIGMVAREK